MFPEFSSDYIQPRRAQPVHSKLDLPFRRQVRNPAREVFEKLAAKLKKLDLPGIEFAGKYLSHLYSRNRRASTLEHNYISIRFFLEFLKAKGIDCIEAVSRKDLAAFIEHEQDRGMRKERGHTYTPDNGGAVRLIAAEEMKQSKSVGMLERELGA